MTNEVATQNTANIMENVLMKGDLSKLTPQERTIFYMKTCESVGLNPLTRPFDYITLNGKLTLYAKRDATDQLRTVHGVSVEELAESEREGVYIVTAKVRNRDGRTDMSKGAVTIAGLKGEALANAMMKAETKAKRRATLSLCGLGLLDETEIETIPNAVAPTSPPDAQPEVSGPVFATPEERTAFATNVIASIRQAVTFTALDELKALNGKKLVALREGDADDKAVFATIKHRFEARKHELTKAAATIDDTPQTEQGGSDGMQY
jgi:hypothetical protein